MLITIDGPAGSGKSTVAKRLAQRLGFFYLDTGSTYRALAFAVYKKFGTPEVSEEEILKLAESIDLKVSFEGGVFKVFLNGEDITDNLEGEEIGKYASIVASKPKVKEFLFKLQRKLVNKTNAVVDGRDAGLYVFPEADFKFFITASPEERARRRFEQLKQKGLEISYEEILNAIKERDERDKNRPLYPFRPADDATVIDTTNLSIEEVLDKIFTAIRPYLNVLITGVGSGLGTALTEEFLKRGYKVYALSRRAPERLKNLEGFFLSRCDLSVLEEVYHKTKSVLSLINDKLPWVILNAGVLGELKEMRKTSLRELNAVLDVNLWSNKLIFDALLDSLNDETLTDIGQIIAISSGAAVNCNKGWNGYSISKAALNCTVKLYSHEFEKTHLASVAPGLILTPMLEKLLNEADEERFPSVKRLKLSPKHTPESAAKMLLEVFANLARFPSGSFLDVRREFAEIYRNFLP